MMKNKERIMNNLVAQTQNEIEFWQSMRDLFNLCLRIAFHFVLVVFILALFKTVETLPEDKILSSCTTEASREFGSSCDRELIKHLRKNGGSMFKLLSTSSFEILYRRK